MAISTMENENNTVEEVLISPIIHVRNMGHFHEYITEFAQAMNHWLKLSETTLQDFCKLLETLHCSKLLETDIALSTATFSGRDTSHMVYGVPYALNTSQYGIVLGMDMVLKIMPRNVLSEAFRVCIDKQKLLAHSEVVDNEWREEQKVPTEEEFMEVLQWRSSALYGVNMAQLLSENKSDYQSLCVKFGCFVTLSHDYQKLLELKETGNDSSGILDNGNCNLALIHAINSRPGDHTLMKIWRQHPTNAEVKVYMVQLMLKYGSLDHLKKLLQNLGCELLELCKEYGGNPELVSIIKEISAGNH